MQLSLENISRNRPGISLKEIQKIKIKKSRCFPPQDLTPLINTSRFDSLSSSILRKLDNFGARLPNLFLLLDSDCRNPVMDLYSLKSVSDLPPPFRSIYSFRYAMSLTESNDSSSSARRCVELARLLHWSLFCRISAPRGVATLWLSCRQMDFEQFIHV